MAHGPGHLWQGPLCRPLRRAWTSSTTANQGHLEYDFVLAPGGQTDGHRRCASRVRQKLQLDAQGALQILSHGRQLAFEHPVAVSNGAVERRTLVPASLPPWPVRQCTSKLGGTTTAKPLIIDPVLSYLSYLGAAARTSSVTAISAANVSPGQAAALDSAAISMSPARPVSGQFPQKGGLAAPPAKLLGRHCVLGLRQPRWAPRCHVAGVTLRTSAAPSATPPTRFHGRFEWQRPTITWQHELVGLSR